MKVPFFRPPIGDREVDAVVRCLRSGWLTTGPVTREFEARFAEYTGARYAVALNSCTAALHLALEAVGLRSGELVLVPTLTFAATAEVVRYFGATPVFVDSEPETLCMDLGAARATLESLKAGRPVAGLAPPHGRPRAIVPMHYGGQMADMAATAALADDFGLRVVTDAAHALPASQRIDGQWRPAGAGAEIACFSFYANKCITTGEGGMAVTDDASLAERMRLMSLHGMSKDAWRRFEATGSWDYAIVAPGYKYNLTDIAASLGVTQLERSDEFLRARRSIAERYRAALGSLDALELPSERSERRHAWHLFVVRLDSDRLAISRTDFIEALRERGIGTSVHYRPLHLQAYYREQYGYSEGLFPVAEREWERMVSLPIFPGMTDEEVDAVVEAVRAVVSQGSNG